MGVDIVLGVALVSSANAPPTPLEATMFLALIAFVIGVVVGAYSHKWLAKETGAPANVTVQNVADIVKKA